MYVSDLHLKNENVFFSATLMKKSTFQICANLHVNKYNHIPESGFVLILSMKTIAEELIYQLQKNSKFVLTVVGVYR